MVNKVPKWLVVYFIIYVLSIPILVVTGKGGTVVRITLDILALIGLFYIPLYLRSREKWLSLATEKRKGIMPIFYPIVMNIGGIYATLMFGYILVVGLMIVLQKVTGITQSQDIPDLSHLNFGEIFYMAFSAGLTEEVWRFALIILFLLGMKKVFGLKWNEEKNKIISLVLAVIFSSLVFGWLHSFGYSDSFFSVPITLQIGTIGFVLALIGLVTRRLWLAIFFHTYQDVFSLTIHAKVKPNFNLESEKEALLFFEKYSSLFGTISLLIFVGFIFFLISMILIRYSKGAVYGKEKFIKPVESNEQK